MKLGRIREVNHKPRSLNLLTMSPQLSALSIRRLAGLGERKWERFGGHTDNRHSRAVPSFREGAIHFRLD